MRLLLRTLLVVNTFQEKVKKWTFLEGKREMIICIRVMVM